MNHRELIAALTPLHGAGEARAIVRMVMEERFGLTQTDLLLGKDTDLSANNRKEMEKIARRLIAGEPVQHVLGFADFCGHRFHVTPDVLIPRPETEELVSLAIDEMGMVDDVSILDLCTGSGCIAISLALAFPNAHVVGIDISEPALAVARANARSLGAANVVFRQGDVLKEVGRERSFSLLVSNPPYVRASEAAGIHPTVLDHEPALALFVPDDDPLRFYRAIARLGNILLVPDGPVLVEVNAALADDTLRLFVDEGYTNTEVRDDRYGRPRMLKAVKRR